VAALPDTMKKAPDVPDVSKIQTYVERSAADVHEAYLLRI
jgi:hypothetical protein